MRATIARATHIISILLAATLVAAAPVAAVQGDCDGDGSVTINELITAVRISLGEASLDTCAEVDRDDNGQVSIDELIAAVRQALDDEKPQQRAFIVTSNFTAGSYATVELETPRAVTPSSSRRRVHRDAAVRTREGLVYIVNRLFGDNLQLLDPQEDFRTVFQCSTGNGTNPHDIAFATDDKAYISLYEESELLVVDPSPQPDCSDFVIGSIDLSSVADDDGIPDMDQMVVVGERLYVVLQRLDIDNILRLPAGPGAIAVIDIASDTLVDSIELVGENPFTATKGVTTDGASLYVGSAGAFEVLDGGLERIDLATGDSAGFVVTEAALGGDLTDFVLVDDNLGYAIVARPGFTAALVSFDPASGQVLDTVFKSDGFTLVDIELNDRGEIYLADRTREQDGIRIFDAATGTALVDDPIDLGLAPFEIVFLE